MTREEWQRLHRARALLGLPERATLAEIRAAYRRLCRRHHPDLQAGREDDATAIMQDVNAAYRIVLDYCKTYRFPLTAESTGEESDEDWWMNRFGQDPLWGPGKGK